MSEHFDVVVVGSGFGGSVMAYELAKAKMKVCLLERGQAFPPGSFPRSPREVARNFWDPSERLYGMFDLWSFRKSEAVVASGLGGGSLIYANVLIRKPAAWFERDLAGGARGPWPLSYTALEPHYEEVERMLGGGRCIHQAICRRRQRPRRERSLRRLPRSGSIHITHCWACHLPIQADGRPWASQSGRPSQTCTTHLVPPAGTAVNAILAVTMEARIHSTSTTSVRRNAWVRIVERCAKCEVSARSITAIPREATRSHTFDTHLWLKCLRVICPLM